MLDCRSWHSRSQEQEEVPDRPVPGDFSLAHRATELTEKCAAISNDGLIFRTLEDELAPCSLPEGSALSEYVSDEGLECPICTASFGSSAWEDGIPAGTLHSISNTPPDRLFLRLITTCSLSLSDVPSASKRVIIHPIA